MIDPVEALKLIVMNGLGFKHKYTLCSAASIERLLGNVAPVIPVIQFKVPFAYIFLIAVWEDIKYKIIKTCLVLIALLNNLNSINLYLLIDWTLLLNCLLIFIKLCLKCYLTK